MIKAHPCLKSDFQVYLRNDGSVLNIDLDRCKRNKSGSVSLSDKEMSRLARKVITLTTQPLRLTSDLSGIAYVIELSLFTCSKVLLRQPTSID